jgi:hypothetical protein
MKSSNIEYSPRSKISIVTEVKSSKANKRQNTFENKIIKKKLIYRNDKTSTIKMDCSSNKLNHVKPTIKTKAKITLKMKDEELNQLNYEEAITKDQRTYFQYYLSLIKKKQIIIFSFFTSNDYNIKTIKISLFFVNFSLYFVINGFFFSDNSMHKIFLRKESGHFFYQIPQILYSTLVSIFFHLFLKALSISEPSLLEFKNDQETNDVMSKGKEIERKIKKRFVIFYIVIFLLMLFFWYYISCFCAVYKNTQIILIKDTLISFVLSNLYPFVINIFPGIFRIPSLKAKNKDKKILYKIGSFIALL